MHQPTGPPNNDEYSFQAGDYLPLCGLLDSIASHEVVFEPPPAGEKPADPSWPLVIYHSSRKSLMDKIAGSPAYASVGPVSER
jgi:hypothetical protein